MALVAVLHAGDRDLLLRTEGRLFKRQLNARADVVALHGGAGAAARAAAAAAEKAAENIAEVAEIAESCTAERAASRIRVEIRVDTREAVLIVARALIRIGEHLVGLVDLLEFFFRARIVVHVRMILRGKLAVGALDIGVRRILFEAKDLIIISLVLICHAAHLS